MSKWDDLTRQLHEIGMALLRINSRLNKLEGVQVAYLPLAQFRADSQWHDIPDSDVQYMAHLNEPAGKFYLRRKRDGR